MTFLKSVARCLGVAEPSAQAVPKPPPTLRPPALPTGPTREECLALLEISSSTSLSGGLVRRQWTLLSEPMAPEKAGRMGPEFLKVAEKQQAAVRQAAEILLELMGEKLEVMPSEPSPQDLRHNPDLDDVFGGM